MTRADPVVNRLIQSPGAPHIFGLLKHCLCQPARSLGDRHGTAEGGIIAANCDELQIPVRYIGIGESVDDLRPFDPEEFTNVLS